MFKIILLLFTVSFLYSNEIDLDKLENIDDDVEIISLSESYKSISEQATLIGEAINSLSEEEKDSLQTEDDFLSEDTYNNWINKLLELSSLNNIDTYFIDDFEFNWNYYFYSNILILNNVNSSVCEEIGYAFWETDFYDSSGEFLDLNELINYSYDNNIEEGCLFSRLEDNDEFIYISYFYIY